MTNIFITSARPNERYRSLRAYLATGEITGNVFVPSTGPCDWKPLLANPEEQWEAPANQRERLLTVGKTTKDSPQKSIQILRQSETIYEIEPLLIFPEWKVPLPGGNKPSQNDVWVLAKAPEGLVSISIEGKVDEAFADPLGKWMVNASDGRRERLLYLMSCLALSSQAARPYLLPTDSPRCVGRDYGRAVRC